MYAADLSFSLCETASSGYRRACSAECHQLCSAGQPILPRIDRWFTRLLQEQYLFLPHVQLNGKCTRALQCAQGTCMCSWNMYVIPSAWLPVVTGFINLVTLASSSITHVKVDECYYYTINYTVMCYSLPSRRDAMLT